MHLGDSVTKNCEMDRGEKREKIISSPVLFFLNFLIWRIKQWSLFNFYRCNTAEVEYALQKLTGWLDQHLWHFQRWQVNNDSLLIFNRHKQGRRTDVLQVPSLWHCLEVRAIYSQLIPWHYCVIFVRISLHNYFFNFNKPG